MKPLKNVESLLYRYRLGKISRFVYIQSLSDRHIVAKKLQRNDRQRIRKIRIGFRQVDHIIATFSTSVLPALVTAITNAPLVFTS